MPPSAFRRQPEPAAAAAWFGGVAGQAILASQAETLRQAAQERPGQAGLWLCPSGMGESDIELPLLRLRAAARGPASLVAPGPGRRWRRWHWTWPW